MRIYLVLLIAFFSIASYSQGKYIAVSRKHSKRIETIDENTRIKIKTIDGKKYWGRFKVVDSASIMIKGNIVPLNSIVKIQIKSVFVSIAQPVYIVVGSLCVIGGVAGAVAGGFGLIATMMFTPIGIPMVLVPSIPDNHPSKNWEYAIKSNDKSGPSSNQIKVGQSESKEKSTGGKS